MLGIRTAIGMVSPRVIARAAIAGLTASLAGLAIVGTSVDLIANPWFERETSPQTVDWIVLIALSTLAGAIVSTYFLGHPSPIGTRTALGSCLLGWLALGLSGIAGFSEPIQLTLATLAVALAAGAFAARMRFLLSPTCSIPAPPKPEA